ncbi:MAG: hypothetical protein J6Q19_00575 [Bacteroidaceae bacterium]|nr:hypothetical protein [Bacteroidaceae bacterium]
MSKETKIMKAVAAAAFDVKFKAGNRAKLTDIKRENIYNSIINRIGNQMFRWKGFPDEVLKTCKSMQIELAVNCGAAAFYKVPESTGSVNAGDWTCTPINFTGCLKNNFTSDHFITSGSDYSLTDEQIGAYIIIKNDPFLSCEYDVTEWFASMLADTDLSERRLIRWARMTPIAKATSGIEAAKLEEVLKAVYEGEPFKVLNDDTKLVTGGGAASRDDQVLRLIDESAIEKMHFLSEFHYELIRRLCNLYNMPFRTTAKSAQNLESELHNTDVFSQALDENRLYERQAAAAAISEMFGWDITVDYGETIEKENDIIDSNVQQEINEGDPDGAAYPDGAADPDDEGEGDSDDQ